MAAVNESAGFFGEIAYTDEEIPQEIPRDQWGRPKIVPPDGGEPIAYTRASTLANYITSKRGLNRWRERHVAQGVAYREDLAAMIAAMPHHEQMTPEEKKELDEVIEMAFEFSGGNVKANHGTAIHAFTDPHVASGPVPQRMQEDVRSWEAVAESTGLNQIISELFVVNDELRVAGTLDAIFAVPAMGIAVTGDKKTGRRDLHATALQVGSYANAAAYHPVTHERKPLHQVVIDVLGVDIYTPEFGLYVHIPRGEGKTTLHPLDLTRGYHMARIAALEVREFQQDRTFVKEDATEWLAQQRNVQVLEAISACQTMDDLRAVYAANAWRWTEKIDKFGQQRMVEIGGPHA